MSRQRLRPSLGESSLGTCPTCNGRGYVRGPESLALSILRIVEEEAMKDMTGRIVARLPIEVATFLLNEKREGVFDIEKRTGVQVILVPDPSVTLPNYEVERVREEDQRHDSVREASYELTAEVEVASAFATEPTAPADEPAVKVVPPPAPPPVRSSSPTETSRETGLLARLWRKLSGKSSEPTPPSPSSRMPSRNSRHGTRRDSTGRGRGDNAEPRRRGGATRRGESHSNHSPNHGDSRRRRGARPTPVAAETEASNEHGTIQSESPAVSSGESRSRSVRRGSRRGRRGGSRNRGREGARPNSGTTEARDASRTDTPRSMDDLASPAETEITAPAKAARPHGRAGAGTAPESNGGRAETKGDTAAPTGPGSPPDMAHDPADPATATRPTPQGLRSRDTAGARPAPVPLSPAESTSPKEVGAQPRRSAETKSSAEPTGG